MQKASTHRIQLSSCISALDVHLGKVTVAGNLDKVWSLDEVCRFQDAIRYAPGASTISSAIGDLNLFGCANFSLWVGGTPEAEVFDAVDNGCLAL